MRRILLILGLVLSLLTMSAQNLDIFEFIDKDGNVIPDGTTLTLTEVTSEEDIFTGEVISYMYSHVKLRNKMASNQAMRINLTIERIDNGSYQLCFPMACKTFDEETNVVTEGGVLSANEVRDLQTEWIPIEEGYCDVVLTVELLNMSGSIINPVYTYVCNGPTIKIHYRNGEIGTNYYGNVWVLGNVDNQGWDPSVGTLMTYNEADGIYELTANFKANSYFSFTTALASNSSAWSEIDSNRFGAPTNMYEISDAILGIPIVCGAFGVSKENAFVIKKADTYTIKLAMDDVGGNIVLFERQGYQPKPICDVNADGSVDISDVNAVINVMLGKGGVSATEADVNGDGIVDIFDVNEVINVMLGKDSKTLINEGFEGVPGTQMTATLPNGWEVLKQYPGANMNYQWAVHYSSSGTTMSGHKYAACDAPTYADPNNMDALGPRTEILLTPAVLLDNTYQLAFDWEAAAYGVLEQKQYTFKVGIVDIAAGDTTVIFDITNEEQVRASGVPADPNGQYIWENWAVQTSKIDLSPWQGKTIKVAFIYDLLKPTGNIIYLDNVSIKQSNPR